MEAERQLTDEEVGKLEKEYEARDGSEVPTTTAPEGASMEDVEAGIRDVEEVRREMAQEDAAPGLTSPSALSTTVQPAEQTGV